MTTKPTTDPYNWATNAGTRVAPNTTTKGTGARFRKPMGFGVFNHLVGVISDWVVWLKTRVEAMHVPVLRPRFYWVSQGSVGAADTLSAGRRVSIAQDSTLSYSAMCPRDSHSLLVGYGEDTTPSIEVRSFDLAANSAAAVGSAVTVDTGSALESAGLGLVKLDGDSVLCVYHVSGSLEGRVSTDKGATWGSAVTVWDPSVADASDDFAAYRLKTLRLSSGRIIVSAAYIDDSIHSSNPHIRYVYSDDDGATWSTNSGAGFDIMTHAGSDAFTRHDMWQDVDGYIWTVATDSSNQTVYQRSGNTVLPDPSTPSSPGVAATTSVAFTEAYGVVVDPSGGVCRVGYGGTSNNIVASALVPSGSTLEAVHYVRHPIVGTGVRGTAAVGPDGGFYVPQVTAGTPDDLYLYEFDVLRQPIPE